MQKKEKFFNFSLVIKSYKKHLVFFLHWRVSLQSQSQKQVILGRKTWHFIIALRYTHQIWKTNHDWLHFLSRFVLFKHSIILIFVGATSIKGSAMTSIARAGASAGPRQNKQRWTKCECGPIVASRKDRPTVRARLLSTTSPPFKHFFSCWRKELCLCVTERERETETEIERKRERDLESVWVIVLDFKKSKRERKV